MSQYEEVSLARLKCELRERDARVSVRKWELVQQARTAKSHTCVTYDGVCHMSDARALLQDCL